MLEVRLLGTFEIKHKKKLISIPSRSAQSLFAYLILNAGTAHRREKLAGMLWPDSLEETARDNLRHALWRLRKALGPAFSTQFLYSDDLAIKFERSSEYWLDAAALEQLSERASVDELISVLAEYQGQLLPGFYDEWVASEREHLDSIFEHHMARLMALLQKEKRWQEILDWGERWIKLGQRPEPAYRALMTAHAAKGDMSKVAGTFERCVKSLRELGIQPSDQTLALYERLKAGQETFETGPAITEEKKRKVSSRSNLPIPLTSFIGREREIEEVKRLLSTTRLLTLTGPGGIGKTRLAIQTASDLIGAYRDGICWVELSALTEPSLVPQAVAQALDVRETPARSLTEALKNFLRERQMLLTLDNCEHLITACARLADVLLSSCVHLKILTTSREALGITGETTFHVPVLSFPTLADLSRFEYLGEFESIQLFAERAAAISPDLALTRDNALAVARICHRLDGIPLALELATARVKVLTLEEIANRLDDRFSLLTQGSRTALPRHQTLRATIDWSYELLSEPERILFRRLSVFAGGFTSEAAEVVAAVGEIDRSQIFPLLESLISKSLVMVHEPLPGGENESRYRMLETIREFAGQKLQETGEEAELRARHVEFYAAFAERGQKGIYSTQQAGWFKRLDQEVDNLRAALDWHASSVSKQKRSGLRSVTQNQFLIISSLSLFWERGYRSEIIETLKKMLSLDAQAEPTAEKATALDVGGFLLWSLNRLEEARAFLEESIRIAQQLKDDSLLVWPLMYLGWTFWGLKEYERAREYLERSLTIARSLGESGRGAVAVAMAYLGDIPYAQGNLAKARKVYEEAISMLRDLGNPSMLSPSLRRLAYIEVRETKFDKAVSLFNESLESNLQLGHQHGTIACLAGFAAVHLAKGNTEHAAVLYGCIENLLEQLGSPLLFTDTVEYERSVAHLQQRLDEQILSRAWSKGGKMTLEEAIKLARKEL